MLNEHEVVKAEVDRIVAEANTAFSQVERVKKYTLLDEEWMPDSEEMTPTMKLKRRGIHTKYEDAIEAMYHALSAGTIRGRRRWPAGRGGVRWRARRGRP